MRRPFPLIPLLLASTAAALGTGCIHVSTANDQAVHADGTVMTSALPPSDAPSYVTPDAPSVTGLDRSAWPQTVYTVPQRDVEHQTLYRSKPVAYTHASALQRGEYPTAETAGEDVTKGSHGDQALEALVAPLNAVGELIMMLPRAVMNKPTTPARGPTVPIERVPPSPAISESGAASGPAPQPTPQPVPPPEIITNTPPKPVAPPVTVTQPPHPAPPSPAQPAPAQPTPTPTPSAPAQEKPQ